MPCSAADPEPSRPCIPDRRKPTRRSLRSLAESPRRASPPLRGRPRWPGSRAGRAGVLKCPPPHVPSNPSCPCARRSRPDGRSPGWISACASPVWPPSVRRPALRKPQKYAQIVDHLLEDARFEPPLRLLVDRLPRRQVVGHVSPRRAGAYDPPQSVEDLAQVVLALGGVLPHEREVRGDKRPLLVGNVAWVWFSSTPCQDAIVSELKFITPSRVQ